MPIWTPPTPDPATLAKVDKQVALDDRIDNLARTLYEVRSQMPHPMDDEKWTYVKKRFASSVTVLRQEAARMIEDGEMDD